MIRNLIRPGTAALAVLISSACLFTACGMSRKPDVATIGSIRGEPTVTVSGVRHTPARNGELVMFEGLIYQVCIE